MKTWARIVNGVVAELITLPSTVNTAALFAPGITVVDVSTISPAPAVGWTYSGSNFAAPAAPPAATPAAAARAAKMAGCQVVSAAFTALSATYPVGEMALGRMAVAAQLIAMNGNAFPAGVTALAVKDMGGTLRTVTTAAEYLALYVALAGYAVALDQIALANAGTLPAQPVDIA